jgi:hypothetical protein
MAMKKLLLGSLVAAVVLTGAAGCGGKDNASTKTPATVSTPGVQSDGNYRLGTMPTSDSAAAVKAAVAALPVALSYDYRTLDASLKKATALMTPAFATKFADTFKSTTVAMATEKKAITTALVRAAGIVGSIDNGRALVLIYLDQVLVSSKDKKASDPLKVSQNSVHVSLRKIDGKWKVDDIEPF